MEKNNAMSQADKNIVEQTVLRAQNLQTVREKVGSLADQGTREGVMSDVLAVLVVGFSHLTVAIAKAKTLDDIKTAAAPLAVIGEVIDAGIKDGSIKLPYMVKKGGAEAVLQDMVKLSNGVTQVLQSAQKA